MDVTTLKLEGRLDTATVSRMETAFAARAGALTQQGDRAILDLRDVTYLSSMGIRLLIATLKQFKQRGIAFATLPPGDATVSESLRIANLTGHLNMAPTAEAARALLVGNP